MKNVKLIRKELLSLSSDKKIDILSYFFKTNKGSYGEGDKFISGASVPKLREIAKKYKFISIKEIENLLNSEYHEERSIALFILVEKYKTTTESKEKNKIEEKKIFNFYLKNTKNINNWDLVDLSCYKIVGKYLFKNKKERKILYKLAKSNKGLLNKNKRSDHARISSHWQWLWERRIAIISLKIL
jgi:3-methyladenine DNA glycosylase AlkD